MNKTKFLFISIIILALIFLVGYLFLNRWRKVENFSSSDVAFLQIGNDIDGEAADDQSGSSVSVSSDGTIVAIGAKYYDGNGLNSGHVRVYQYDGSQWTQIGA